MWRGIEPVEHLLRSLLELLFLAPCSFCTDICPDSEPRPAAVEAHSGCVWTLASSSTSYELLRAKQRVLFYIAFLSSFCDQIRV